MTLAVTVSLVAALTTSSPQATRELRRSGALHWGLGLELPMVGVITGVGRESSAGWGYHLGASVSWEFLPTMLARLYVCGGETHRGRAVVSYLENDQRVRKKQRADWVGITVGLGGAYLFRDLSRTWAPYVGADAGLSFDGYTYHFDEELEDLEARDIGGIRDPTCTSDDCRGDIHDAVTLGYAVSVRGGIRLEILSYLATQAEIMISYAPFEKERVSNTLIKPGVRSVSDDLWIIATTFSIRLGL